MRRAHPGAAVKLGGTFKGGSAPLPAQKVAELIVETREHDRRLTRIEAKWEAAVELAAVRRPGPRRLEEQG